MVKSKICVQTILVPKSKFTKKKAVKWIRDHGFKATKIDDSKNYYHFRQIDPSKADTLGTKTIKKHNIKLVIADCRL